MSQQCKLQAHGHASQTHIGKGRLGTATKMHVQTHNKAWKMLSDILVAQDEMCFHIARLTWLLSCTWKSIIYL